MMYIPTCRPCQDFCYSFSMEDFPFLIAAISNVITEQRENAGLSKRKLSQLSGIDRVYILQVEQGKFRPTVNFMFLIARGLDLRQARYSLWWSTSSAGWKGRMAKNRIRQRPI